MKRGVIMNSDRESLDYIFVLRTYNIIIEYIFKVSTHASYALQNSP